MNIQSIIKAIADAMRTNASLRRQIKARDKIISHQFKERTRVLKDSADLRCQAHGMLIEARDHIDRGPSPSDHVLIVRIDAFLPKLLPAVFRDQVRDLAPAPARGVSAPAAGNARPIAYAAIEYAPTVLDFRKLIKP